MGLSISRARSGDRLLLVDVDPTPFSPDVEFQRSRGSMTLTTRSCDWARRSSPCTLISSSADSSMKATLTLSMKNPNTAHFEASPTRSPPSSWCAWTTSNPDQTARPGTGGDRRFRRGQRGARAGPARARALIGTPAVRPPGVNAPRTRTPHRTALRPRRRALNESCHSDECFSHVRQRRHWAREVSHRQLEHRKRVHRRRCCSR
jgi:hypothetical protein